MAGIVEGKPLDECVDMGQWLAKLSIQELGPQYVIPTFLCSYSYSFYSRGQEYLEAHPPLPFARVTRSAYIMYYIDPIPSSRDPLPLFPFSTPFRAHNHPLFSSQSIIPLLLPPPPSPLLIPPIIHSTFKEQFKNSCSLPRVRSLSHHQQQQQQQQLTSVTAKTHRYPFPKQTFQASSRTQSK